ncbi:MAG: BatD family protein [Pseudomonadota bacterium]|nr:BatD family protein [Pseudomonadota bacterium]
MNATVRLACARALMTLMLLACAHPVCAQTRAWLDREQVTYGETATLNIETDASVKQIDYAPLTASFEVGGQTVRRSFQRVNGRSSTRSLFAVGIRPRGPGIVTVPALRVGGASTEPLRMTVMPPSVQRASSNADAFLETEVDAESPYVQQAVGVVVRLSVGVDLLSGQLDQDQPPDASLQQVGEDVRYQRQLDGRPYSVIERRYLLIPERSGTLVIPGARFNGQAVGGFFDRAFGDGREPLSAAAPVKRIQVRKIPVDAPQPWLPLHDLRLGYLQLPQQGRAGVATTVELEMIADGASATQLPSLQFPPSQDAQVFAEPPQTEVQLVNGRPRATQRRRISIVPLRAGTLRVAGPSVQWWDAKKGIARTATLPPLVLQVAPGVANSDAGDDPALKPAAEKALRTGADAPAAFGFSGLRQQLPWLAGLLGLVVLLGGWWFSRHRKAGVGRVAVITTPAIDPLPKVPSLDEALKVGELGSIAEALCNAAGLPGENLDALRERLNDVTQVAAVNQLQAARWGDGDASVALVSLRSAFARGLQLQRRSQPPKVMLPPLYPQA